MKTRITCAALALGLGLAGCAALQTSRTEARWQINENQYVEYDSNKDQQGLEARIEEIDPTTGEVAKTIYVKADKSGTPEMLFQLMAQQSQLNARSCRR